MRSPHVLRVVQSGNTLIGNPEGVSLQDYDDVHPQPHIMETDLPHARYAMVKSTEAARRICEGVLRL